MQDCRRIRDLIGPYVYDELDAAERAMVDGHLRQCQRCRDEFTETRQFMQRIPSGLLEAPPQLEERVLSGLTAETMSRAHLARRIWGPVRLALAGAALLALGFWIGYELPRPPLSRDVPRAAAPDVAAAKRATPAGNAELPTTASDLLTEPTTGAETLATAGPREGEGQVVPAVQALDLVQIRAPRPVGLDDVTVATVAAD